MKIHRLDPEAFRDRRSLGAFLEAPGAALLDGWSDASPFTTLCPWPEEIVTLPWSRAGEWPDVLNAIDSARRRRDRPSPFPFAGGWIGFVCYDAGAMLEGGTLYDEAPPEPALFLSRHDRVIVIDADGNTSLVCGEEKLEESLRAIQSRAPAASAHNAQLSSAIGDSLGEEAFEGAVGEIRDRIARGDVYQVNLTRAWTASARVDPFALYLALTGARPPRCSAFVRGDGWSIASASPEVFLTVDRITKSISSRPIKGTVRRHGDDSAEIAALFASSKDASEHLMIVDLLRNDIGKVASPGGVSVPAYRTLRTLEHVHHLESTIRGDGVTAELGEIFGALFPSGSITGAPKRAAISAIRSLEPVPRGVYTGAIGFLDDSGQSEWSVAIRTAVVTPQEVRYHAGGGIVWDSDASSESRESIAKSIAFLEYFGGRT